MSGIDAATITAEVVELESRRDRTYREFIGNPVGQPRDLGRDGEHAIAALVDGSGPDPASVRPMVGFGPEPGRHIANDVASNGGSQRIAEGEQTRVVALAPSRKAAVHPTAADNRTRTMRHVGTSNPGCDHGPGS